MRTKLKILFVILFSLFAIGSLFSQTTYYVKNGGSDAAAGTSDATAWETITKVNSIQSSLVPGDNILFKRGDTFIGTITANKSGTLSDRIIYGAYGEGADPIITGFTNITEWTPYNDSIYFALVPVEPTFIKIHDNYYAMGRYPNDAWLNWESASTNVSITDNQLTNEPNWTGAGMVLSKADWVVDRCNITNHTNSTLTYTSLGSSANAGGDFGTEVGYGYFFQKHLRTLDQFGEWFWKTDTLFIHFGNVEPVAASVPQIDNLYYAYRINYITIQDINFTGSNKSAIFSKEYNTYTTIQNCSISYAGMHGIETTIARLNLIDNNMVDKCISAGIFYNGGHTGTITNNTITRTGMLLGATLRTDNHVAGIQYYNVDSLGLIQYNYIDSSGYNGIRFNGKKVQIKNNYIKNSVLVYNDGGGIYTANLTNTGRVIRDNIVIGSYGNEAYSNKAIKKYGSGIYLDSGWSGNYDIDVIGNTVAYCRNDGFAFHDSKNDTIYGNTSYGNANQVKFQRFAMSQAQASGNYITDNKFIASAFNQSTLKMSAHTYTSNYNYFVRPVDDNDHFVLWQDGDWRWRNLAQYRTFTGQDANSVGSPIYSSTTDTLYYNATSENDTITVVDMITLDGEKISGDIVLLPWTSLVLLVDPAPAPPPLPIVVSDTLIMQRWWNVQVTATVTDTAGTISERGVVYSTEGIPTISDTKVTATGTTGSFTVNLTSLETGRIYYIRPYATNQSGPGYGYMYTLYTPNYTMFKSRGRFLKYNGKFLVRSRNITPQPEPEPEAFTFDSENITFDNNNLTFDQQ